MKKHRFRTIEKKRGGRKAGQHKKVRVGSRAPGTLNQGSIRRPF